MIDDMRPRISWYRGCWRCARTKAAIFFVGYGDTPAEAYDDWLDATGQKEPNDGTG